MLAAMGIRSSTREADGASRLRWSADDEFVLDGTEYGCRPIAGYFPSTVQRLCIRKPRAAVERYESLLQELRPRSIFEAGIYEGGSAALIAQLARPEKLVAIDINAEPSAGLEQFVREHEAGGSIAAHWGVDQSDQPRLERILAEELGSEPLDLVIDDASHLLAQSRTTFNTLFPRLRPGGSYLLEDWSWAHAAMNFWPQRTPLTVLVFEIVIASAHNPGLIERVEIDRAWAVIRRGPEPADPGSFDVGELGGPTGQELIGGLTSAATKGPPKRRWRRR